MRTRFRINFRARGTAGLLCLAALGCAGPNQIAATASRVSIAELNGNNRGAAAQKLSRMPVLLEFNAGDRIPVSLALDSELATLEAQEITLVAKRKFYLLLRDDGPPLLSGDGVEFEERRKNSFFMGFEVRKTHPTRMRLGVGIWPEG